MKEYLNKEFLLSNKERIIKSSIAAVIVIAAFAGLFLGGDDGKNKEMQISSTAPEAAEPIEDDLIMVDVCGAVNEPKVVELEAESRVTDAIKAAGGFTENADTTHINQAAFLTDGEKIYVPQLGEDVTGIALDSGVSAVNDKVDINTATSEELQTLDGVGPATAEKIIKYRSDEGRFKSIEEIKNVDGIGDKTFENLKEYIQV